MVVALNVINDIRCPGFGHSLLLETVIVAIPFVGQGKRNNPSGAKDCPRIQASVYCTHADPKIVHAT